MLLRSAATAMTPPSSRQMADCSHMPVCPVCGGIECLCRPRFFAGQLLTEDDLNRLEQYVLDKNRLHNRYLHGWGVVCGLEVVCNNCAGFVTVGTGYALSPCGDDIVVCKDASVNVCDLIQRCRLPASTPDCAPPFTDNDPNCADLVEDWILAICYDETTSRGRIALRGASGGPSCGCGCSSSGSSGRSSGCGCGCHSTGSTQTTAPSRSTMTRSQSVASQCEPTLICEGYKFIAYKAPLKRADKGREGVLNSELIKKVSCCLQELTTRITSPPSNPTNEQLHTWICDVKTAMLDLLADHPTYDCTAYRRLGQILCPTPLPNETPADYSARVSETLLQIARIAAEFIRYCICSALLPPCPPPADSACVPLATVTIRRSDCQIQKVCNWGPRRFVTTFPYIGYLLSVTGLMEKLRAAIETVCCAPFQQKSRTPFEPSGGVQPNIAQPAGMVENSAAIHPAAAQPSAGVTPSATGGVSEAAINIGSRQVSSDNKPAFAPFFMQSWLNQDRQIDAQSYLLGLTGATDSTRQPLLSERELANPATFLLANQLVQPTLNAMLPDELTGLLEILAARGAGKDTRNTGLANSETIAGAGAESKSTAANEGDLSELRRMVVELQSQMKLQSEEIARLREAGGKPGGRKP